MEMTQISVLTMMFALMVVSMQQRVELKSVLVVSGEQYVVVDGIRLVPEWFADSWNMNGQVRNYLKIITQSQNKICDSQVF